MRRGIFNFAKYNLILLNLTVNKTELYFLHFSYSEYVTGAEAGWYDIDEHLAAILRIHLGILESSFCSPVDTMPAIQMTLFELYFYGVH